MLSVLTPTKLAYDAEYIGAGVTISYIVKTDGTLSRCGREQEGFNGDFYANPVLTQITDVYRFLDGNVN